MHEFKIDVTLDASLPFVFAAFHEPEYLSEWFAPGDCSVTQIMSDFKEGGRYRIKMMDPSGIEMSLTGEYVTILANEQLSFSWAWEDDMEESVMTSVDIHFEKTDEGNVRLVLIQQGFLNKQECDQHNYAWMSCLEKLAVLAAKKKSFN
ncbi:SRPBCC domain-containing protein [Alteromonas sp. Cnat3-28]|uniref:SRPBCC family protein n=1 Tax=unclassified Alteromonas TaxID=2614992 RepID=UPI001EF242A1|nr:MULTISPECIES: SRPBCC domain-containing protein [unclassified Alteromonas]MCG7637127.1 SRPBCC domain-containing protein [Alteromonas sp. CNT1-28]MCG7645498.1 SRPBCC domain-containing protein [Alteromonas sp. Cnat3-28]MCG7814022.1 SRPBCC domain-containing protein [Alteromonas sp. MCA-1]MEE3027924.1 SRPBCC domain-containing protein [Pseudomonadota bacterium]